MSLTCLASLFMIPSALAAPVPLLGSPWVAGRFHELRLGLVLNIGIALRIVAVVLVVAGSSRSRSS